MGRVTHFCSWKGFLLLNRAENNKIFITLPYTNIMSMIVPLYSPFSGGCKLIRSGCRCVGLACRMDKCSAIRHSIWQIALSLSGLQVAGLFSLRRIMNGDTGFLSVRAEINKYYVP